MRSVVSHLAHFVDQFTDTPTRERSTGRLSSFIVASLKDTLSRFEPTHWNPQFAETVLKYRVVKWKLIYWKSKIDPEHQNLAEGGAVTNGPSVRFSKTNLTISCLITIKPACPRALLRSCPTISNKKTSLKRRVPRCRLDPHDGPCF